jgi:hypothetical protein
MLARLTVARNKLDQTIKEFRKLVKSEKMSRAEAYQIFSDNNFEDQIKTIIQHLSIALTDADKLIEDIAASQVKRGRKFRHFQLMLDQTSAKIRKVYGKQLQDHGISWSDVPE